MKDNQSKGKDNILNLFQVLSMCLCVLQHRVKQKNSTKKLLKENQSEGKESIIK